MIDDVAIVVVVSEHILCWIDEHFHLVANFDLEGNQSHIQLVIHDHADFLELEANKLVVFEGHSIKFILDTG